MLVNCLRRCPAGPDGSFVSTGADYLEVPGSNLDCAERDVKQYSLTHDAVPAVTEHRVVNVSRVQCVTVRKS